MRRRVFGYAAVTEDAAPNLKFSAHTGGSVLGPPLWINIASAVESSRHCGQSHHGGCRPRTWRPRATMTLVCDDCGRPTIGHPVQRNGTILPSHSCQTSGRELLARSKGVFDEDSCRL